MDLRTVSPSPSASHRRSISTCRRGGEEFLQSSAPMLSLPPGRGVSPTFLVHPIAIPRVLWTFVAYTTLHAMWTRIQPQQVGWLASFASTMARSLFRLDLDTAARGYCTFPGYASRRRHNN